MTTDGRDDRGRWLKGHCPNQLGAKLNPNYDPVVAELKRNHVKSIIQWIDDVQYLTIAELNTMANDKQTPVGKIAVCRAYLEAANGNHKHFELMLNHLVGKPVTRVELAGLLGHVSPQAQIMDPDKLQELEQLAATMLLNRRNN